MEQVLHQLALVVLVVVVMAVQITLQITPQEQQTLAAVAEDNGTQHQVQALTGLAVQA